MKLKCLGLASLERTIACQRSCLTWLKEGDANTKFFHLHARAQRRKNFIVRLRSGDQLATSHDELQELASFHFGAIMGTSVEHDLALDLHSLGLCTVQLGGLDDPFSEKEVWAVISPCLQTRRPGQMASQVGSTRPAGR